MTGKTLEQRYADMSPQRIIENPRDEDEQAFADAEAQRDAQRIWDRFGKSDTHRRRVVMLLAQEALKGQSKPQPRDPEGRFE
jgi:hypothetical protein